MNEIGSNERTTTLILPFPVELLDMMVGVSNLRAPAGGNGGPPSASSAG
jgi:hypothetical protein